MTGAEYIAAFLARAGVTEVFTLNGGACAFVTDAVARHPTLHCRPVRHEQAGAMAADGVWRASRRLAATVVTSGPGATNLLTGIACSWFDSIPAFHITGQVPLHESRRYPGLALRQRGFQEARIVDMAKHVVKYAVQVTSVNELRRELAKAHAIALSPRMGPVLIDVPMDVQQAEIDGDILLPELESEPQPVERIASELNATLAGARRPIVLWGAGVGLAGVETETADWLKRTGLPFVVSWNGLSSFDHGHPGFVGPIGVYGSRAANFAIQNADTVIALGSRLDNRQRSSDPRMFAAGAQIHTFDIDESELGKSHADGYRATRLDLRCAPQVFANVAVQRPDPDWQEYLAALKLQFGGRETRNLPENDPYTIVQRFNEVLDDDAVIVADTGAALCWLFQTFRVKRHSVFTAGGNSPMGYALPAAIGAKLAAPHRQVVCYTGDGGLQVNLQELQTIRDFGLNIPILVMNNLGYGIIRQFQDTYLCGRHLGSASDCTAPDLQLISRAYGFEYRQIKIADEITPALFRNGHALIEAVIDPESIVAPKLEMGRPINDQWPYLTDQEYKAANRFVSYARVPRV